MSVISEPEPTQDEVPRFDWRTTGKERRRRRKKVENDKKKHCITPKENNEEVKYRTTLTRMRKRGGRRGEKIWIRKK